MAVNDIRQYVGARYVVKIYENSQDPSSAEWEQGNFEPLVMVTWQNGSYLSKKAVPSSVGNPALNPNYWVQTGFYNGQIASLQAQIDAINNTTIPSIESAVQTLTSNLSALDSKVKSARNKKYIIIGDSYERVTNFGSITSEYLGHGATSYISTNVQKSTDGYVYVASRGGSGFTNDGGGKSSGNGFLNMLTEAFTNMTADEAESIDTILIAGGVNDSFYNVGDSDIALLSTRMDDFNNYALEHFPNAQVQLFFLGRVRQLDTHTGLNPKDVRYNIYRYIDLAGSKGWGYVTNSEFVCYVRENFIDSDNLHPTANEGYVIARYIVEGIINGSVDVTWIDNAFYNISGANGFNGTIPISVNVVNGVRTIRINGSFTLSLGSGTTATLTFGVPYKIATQDGIFASSEIDVFVPLIVWDDTASKFEMMNAELRFSGYDVFVVNRGTPTYGNGAITVQSILTDSKMLFMVDTLIS